MLRHYLEDNGELKDINLERDKSLEYSHGIGQQETCKGTGEVGVYPLKKIPKGRNSPLEVSKCFNTRTYTVHRAML